MADIIYPNNRVFNSICVQAFYSFTWLLMSPFLFVINRIGSAYNQTTEEKFQRACNGNCYTALAVFLTPFGVAFAVVLLPFFLLGFIMRVPFQCCRQNFVYMYPKNTDEENVWVKDSVSESYLLANANILLFYLFMAKFNNMSQIQKRASKIGAIFNQLFSAESKDPSTQIQHFISTQFPKGLDFLCCQEVFDRYAAADLIKALDSRYPYILYDAGVNSCASNLYMTNSGLFFASVYRIERADFNYFDASSGFDRLASKGLLMVKVCLHENIESGQKTVGYIAVTHLNAGGGQTEYDVRDQQMNNILDWMEKFRQKNRSDNETVAFDLLCGDLNFNNISEGGKQNSKHRLMTEVYRDPTRNDDETEADWSTGTSLVQARLYRVNDEPDPNNENVITPDKLKSFLESDTERPIFFQSGAAGEGKSKLDYILYKRDTPIEVEEYHFVTELATLTDHLPTAIKFRPKIQATPPV